MDSNQIDHKGGVLIIGSLLWQDDVHRRGDDIRKTWREKHLLLNEKILVKTPIRFGRLTRSLTYTMTFSNSCTKSKRGTGWFVPFGNKLINTNSELLTEAVALSRAEGMKGKFVSLEQGTNNVWCVLGLLLNPAKLSKRSKADLIKQWRSWIVTPEQEFNLIDFKLGKEKPCLDKNALLNISWPESVDPRESEILDSYDFILATATKPTDYPNPNVLADNVRTDTRYYFIENIKNSITTFQDNAVLNQL